MNAPMYMTLDAEQGFNRILFMEKSGQIVRSADITTGFLKKLAGTAGSASSNPPAGTASVLASAALFNGPRMVRRIPGTQYLVVADDVNDFLRKLTSTALCEASNNCEWSVHYGCLSTFV